MAIRISILAENFAGGNRIFAGHGWSTLIEAGGQKILFDTGPAGIARHNATVMGIDLKQVDKIILSHSHHDHTEGLREILLYLNRNIDVIAHPDIWSMRYNRQEKNDVFMGIPFQRQELEGLGARFNMVTNSLKLSENVWTSGEIPMITDFENESVPLFGGIGRYMLNGSTIKADTILDDMAIMMKTAYGLVVVLGCAHRGIINTLHHARNITTIEKIYAVIGGAHLMSASTERVKKTIAALKAMNIQKIGLCHCTGLEAITLMKHEFGQRFVFCNAGTIHDLP